MLHLTESNKPRLTQINQDLNVCIVRESINGDKTWYYAKNIVTNDGDLFYAQQAGTVTPAKGDTYTTVTTPVTSSRKIIDSTYPKTNDGDSDNTGSGTDIVTWRTSWTTSDFNATSIIGGCIHVGGASPSSGSKLLTHFSITSFDKTSSDTLKIFVNHTFNGV